jgi:serine/threonine protein kinase
MWNKFIDNKKKSDFEIAGLFIQSYLSKPTNEGGLGCPYICKVYEFGYYEIITESGSKEKLVYAVIEKVYPFEKGPYIPAEKDYVTNDPRKTLHEQGKGVEYSNLNNIFKQILEGLKCINQNNYVHLDIKESNLGIKLNKDDTNEARIFDFGFAKYIPLDKQTIEVYGETGTLGYIDPEMHYDFYANSNYYFYHPSSNKHDPRNNFNIKSDIYSLGVVMIKQYFNYLTNNNRGEGYRHKKYRGYNKYKPEDVLTYPICSKKKP